MYLNMYFTYMHGTLHCGFDSYRGAAINVDVIPNCWSLLLISLCDRCSWCALPLRSCGWVVPNPSEKRSWGAKPEREANSWCQTRARGEFVLRSPSGKQNWNAKPECAPHSLCGSEFVVRSACGKQNCNAKPERGQHSLCWTRARSDFWVPNPSDKRIWAARPERETNLDAKREREANWSCQTRARSEFERKDVPNPSEKRIGMRWPRFFFFLQITQGRLSMSSVRRLGDRFRLGCSFWRQIKHGCLCKLLYCCNGRLRLAPAAARANDFKQDQTTTDKSKRDRPRGFPEKVVFVCFSLCVCVRVFSLFCFLFCLLSCLCGFRCCNCVIIYDDDVYDVSIIIIIIVIRCHLLKLFDKHPD